MALRGCVVFLLLATRFHVTTGQAVAVVIQDVRLVGGNATAGRIEVLISGAWGSVCDDEWSDLDAQVACRHLGLTGGTALPLAFYGPMPEPAEVLMDDVFCAGNENRLDECYFTTGDQVNCAHTEDASVVCQPAGSVPVVTPSPTTPKPGVTLPDNCGTSGRTPKVELFGTLAGIGYVRVQAPNGTWGYVCDDSWDTNAAKVVCNELCYATTLTEPGMKQEYAVAISNPVFALDDVNCVGSETSLEDCPRGGNDWFQHNCGDTEIAAVTCTSAVYPTPPAPNPNLECREGDLIALFNKSRDASLDLKFLSVPNTTAANCICTQTPAQCFFDVPADNYIMAKIPFENCNTAVRQNASHIIYSNSILLESTKQEGGISNVNDFLIELTCEMPRNATVDTNVQPLTQVVTQRTEGQFIITMKVYEDQSFTNETPSYPFQLDLGEWVNAAVELESIDSRLKLVVKDCTAKADKADPTAPTMPLLVDKCVAERSTLEMYPLSKVKMGLRFQSFVFVNYPFVVVECDAIVCLTSETTEECDRSCNNVKPTAASGRRRRRSVSQLPGSKQVYTVSSQPIRIDMEPLSSSPSTTSTSTTTTTASTTPKAKATTSRTPTTGAPTVISVTAAGPTPTTTTTRPPAVAPQESPLGRDPDVVVGGNAASQLSVVSRVCVLVLALSAVLLSLCSS